MQQQKHFGEEDICYCPLALPWACPPSQDLTSQVPFPTGFGLDFVRESTLGDRKFGEGGDKRYCHFFSSWGLILVMWLVFLWDPSLDQAAWHCVLLETLSFYPGSAFFANLRIASLSHICKLFYHKVHTWTSFWWTAWWSSDFLRSFWNFEAWSFSIFIYDFL